MVLLKKKKKMSKNNISKFIQQGDLEALKKIQNIRKLLNQNLKGML